MLTAGITCPECGDEELVIDFEAERAEPQTRMDPGYPACIASLEIKDDPCGCDRSEERVEELLWDWLEGTRDDYDDEPYDRENDR